jgi:hypothetical protein
VLLGAAGIFIGRWLIAVLSKPQAALAIERAAGYDTRGASASRMLIIRGVDDEASLSLAAGSIGSRLSYLVLTWVIPGIYVMIVLAMMLLLPGIALLNSWRRMDRLAWGGVFGHDCLRANISHSSRCS